MIPSFEDRAAFEERLRALVSPSRPIRSIERLFGREDELRTIERALIAGGRNVFIYGDRGVGKSSLAATAAAQYQSADAPYIDVAGAPDATFAAIVANIAAQALRISRTQTSARHKKTEISLKWLSYSDTVDTAPTNLRDAIKTLGDAVEVLREVTLLHSEKPIVVIDEFDRISSTTERSLFADLVKQLGDKEIDLKFIFTGVGSALSELLGAHQSAIRQLETLELPKLSWNGRWDIATSILDAFGIEIDRNLYVRIAAVSDGYPFYVHLLVEKLLWRLFDHSEAVSSVTRADYQAAVRDAIMSISAELRRPYETAANQRTDDYEEVLWSTASSEFLHSYLTGMYQAYVHVMEQVPGKAALSYDKFTARIRNLTKEKFGGILVSEAQPGLYCYRENMLRGYVRMQAEAHDIAIDVTGGREEQHYMQVPARARTGYRGSFTPRGVDFGNRGGRK